MLSEMKEFYVKVSGDSELKQEVQALLMQASEVGEEETNRRMIAFAQNAGYQISIEEMKSYFLALAAEKTGVLSDDELDQVAGGKSSREEQLILVSIGTVGIGCGIASALGAINDVSCAEQIKDSDDPRRA